MRILLPAPIQGFERRSSGTMGPASNLGGASQIAQDSERPRAQGTRTRCLGETDPSRQKPQHQFLDQVLGILIRDIQSRDLSLRLAKEVADRIRIRHASWQFARLAAPLTTVSWGLDHT